MSLGQAWGELWPVLMAAGGGYVTLLVLLRQQFEQRLREKDATIAELKRKLDTREEWVWRSLTTADRATAIAESFAPTRQG